MQISYLLCFAVRANHLTWQLPDLTSRPWHPLGLFFNQGYWGIRYAHFKGTFQCFDINEYNHHNDKDLEHFPITSKSPSCPHPQPSPAQSNHFLNPHTLGSRCQDRTSHERDLGEIRWRIKERGLKVWGACWARQLWHLSKKGRRQEEEVKRDSWTAKWNSKKSLARPRGCPPEKACVS